MEKRDAIRQQTAPFRQRFMFFASLVMLIVGAGCNHPDQPNRQRARDIVHNLNLDWDSSEACKAALKAWCKDQAQSCDQVIALANCGPGAYLMCAYPAGKSSAMNDLEDNASSYGKQRADRARTAIRQLCNDLVKSKATEEA